MLEVLQAAERHEQLPRPLFVFMGTIEEGKEFFARFGPQATAIADRSARLYKAFGLARGGPFELFGPRVWLAALRAMRQGHFVGRPVGDPLRMPGMFLLHDGRIRWQHTFRHIGDHPNLDELAPRLARSRA